MRVSKEPEVRKQEIIDAAMKVFAAKGYEAATMKDIAREADVVAGLCYHYFQNKQELYQTAVQQYAKECSRAFAKIFQNTDQTLEESLDTLVKVQTAQEENYKYRDFFGKAGNELFHKQLELYMTKEIFPFFEEYLRCLAQRGEIRTEQVPLMAHFLWGGQLAVINEEAIPITQRTTFLKEVIRKLI